MEASGANRLSVALDLYTTLYGSGGGGGGSGDTAYGSNSYAYDYVDPFNMTYEDILRPQGEEEREEEEAAVVEAAEAVKSDQMQLPPNVKINKLHLTVRREKMRETDR